MIFGNMNDLKSIPVLELIPQRPPFVMIDNLISFDESDTVTCLKIREDNLLFDDGRFTAYGLTENIAQTAAARLGYINHINGKEVAIGYIGAVKNFKVYRTPEAGEEIVTTITIKEEVFKMSLVDAVVRCGEEVIAECEMKIALAEG